MNVGLQKWGWKWKPSEVVPVIAVCVRLCTYPPKNTPLAMLCTCIGTLKKNVINIKKIFGIKVENFRFNDSLYITYKTFNDIKNRISY